MKKLLGIVALSLLWFGTAYAECKAGNCSNGTGTMVWSNGDQYVGEWKDGKFHGVGTLTWSNGIKYAGDWKNGIEDGIGTVTWPNGNKYIGERYNAQAHGQGTFIWSDGSRYVGEWKNDKMHGQGKMTWLDGNFFEGKWKNDFEDRSEPFLTSDTKVAKVVWDDSIPISRKKYIYDDTTSLKRLIKKKAPTTLKELKFIRKTENKAFTGVKGLPEFCKSCKKYQKISYDAYIFHAFYENEDKVLFLVNTEYKSFERAEKQALRYATLLGQLPAFLKESGFDRITISPERRRWIASGKRITIYPAADWYDHEKSLMHEAAHVTVDHLLVNNPNWKAAVDADGKYITKYARTNQWEDSAETVIFWVALRCVDSISKSRKKKIFKSIPNRIKHLDKMNLNTYPLECKK